MRNYKVAVSLKVACGLDNVSVSAAPEPATWALMIVGVGLAGGVLRRKPLCGLSTAAA